MSARASKQGHQKSKQTWQKINSRKTKTMATTDSTLYIRCGNDNIEQVVEFGYLGSIVESTGLTFKEIMTRTGQANAASTSLKRIMEAEKLLDPV